MLGGGATGEGAGLGVIAGAGLGAIGDGAIPTGLGAATTGVGATTGAGVGADWGTTKFPQLGSRGFDPPIVDGAVTGPPTRGGDVGGVGVDEGGAPGVEEGGAVGEVDGDG